MRRVKRTEITVETDEIVIIRSTQSDRLILCPECAIPVVMITPEQAAAHVFACGVGIDLTRRDVQVQARKTGRPWEIGKSFDHSAPCGDLLPLEGGLPDRGRIELEVNGSTRQQGDLAQMIWSCSEIVSELSKQYRLFPGDLIYTGTPAGVGQLIPGDRVLARIHGLPDLRIRIGERQQ